MTSIKSSINVAHTAEKPTLNYTVDEKGNFHTHRHKWYEKVKKLIVRKCVGTMQGYGPLAVVKYRYIQTGQQKTAVRDTCASVNNAFPTLYINDMVYTINAIMILKCTPCGYFNCDEFKGYMCKPDGDGNSKKFVSSTDVATVLYNKNQCIVRSTYLCDGKHAGAKLVQQCGQAVSLLSGE
jgi:hypothetical protein